MLNKKIMCVSLIKSTTSIGSTCVRAQLYKNMILQTISQRKMADLRNIYSNGSKAKMSWFPFVK